MDYRIAHMQGSSVISLYLGREEIWLDPPYQRASEIWPLEKRQLLVDSLLNNFDIPKFYFHEFYPAATIDDRSYRYAIVDGKQRLETIWGYLNGGFALGRDIEIINAPDIDVKGMTYGEMSAKFPRLRAELDSRLLDVITIQTDDSELIEEMFSRLNEAVPLSAAERRNAFRGPLPPRIRELATHAFFQEKLPFGNSRYRHFDLATKFLYLTYSKEIIDLKKAYLDEFVISFRDRQLDSEASAIYSQSVGVLDRLSDTFVDSDPLLRQVGSVTLFFLLFLDHPDEAGRLGRRAIEAFNCERAMNRESAEVDIAEADYDLLEFDRLAQAPNDAVALRYRYEVLRSRLGIA